MSNLDKLMEDIRKIKFSNYSDEELNKFFEILDKKMVELKFEKRSRRQHRP